MNENLIEETLKLDEAYNAGNSAEYPYQKQAGRNEALSQKAKRIPKKYHFNIPAEDADEEEKEAFYRALGVPASASEYKIVIKDKMIASDPEVNEYLRKLGFTPRQVQAVYDLAVERVVPCIHELAANYAGDRQIALLVRHFGGEEKWCEISRQLAAWGTKNLPKQVYEPLACSYEGVLALYNMMNSNEPIIGTSDNSYTFDNEESLKKLMMSEKYWRDKDPATLRRVSNGFEKLYPNK